MPGPNTTSPPIAEEFTGVYLPVPYIEALEATMSHSLAMHLNDGRAYHDVLSVRENSIFSDLKFHDGYGIGAEEGRQYQFGMDGRKITVTDNNGFVYRKIADDPVSYSNAVRTFVAHVVFQDLFDRGIGVALVPGGRTKIALPFLSAFAGGVAYEIVLDDMFYRGGANALLYDRDAGAMLFLVIDGAAYSFYAMEEEADGPNHYRAGLVVTWDSDGDRRVTAAMVGLDENPDRDTLDWLDGLTTADRRVVINGLFALCGYAFVSEEWRAFFGRYSWYRPAPAVRNDAAILSPRQKRLLEYLQSW